MKGRPDGTIELPATLVNLTLSLRLALGRKRKRSKKLRRAGGAA
jgi:hypothetical protein